MHTDCCCCFEAGLVADLELAWSVVELSSSSETVLYSLSLETLSSS